MKDKRITRIISVTVFIFLFSTCFFLTYRMLEWKDTYGNYLSSVKEMYATPKDTMELVFMGSSHTYGGVDPNFFWTEYGIPAFNMAISGQDKDSTVHSLLELLKKQNPKVVVVDVYALLWDRNEDMGNVYRNMLSLKVGKNSNELIRDYVEPEEQRKYFLRWPIVHTRYKELSVYDFYKNRASVVGRGFNYNFVQNPIAFDENAVACTDVEPISEKNEAWVLELEQIAKENGIELLFIQIPTVVSPQEQAILNGFETFTTERGIPYLDLNKHFHEIGLDVNADFVDKNHLNFWGAQKNTVYLANYLLNQYSFIDRQYEDGYELWDKNAEYEYHMLWGQSLENMPLEQYLSEVTAEPKVTTVLSLDGYYGATPTDWSIALAGLGLTEEDYQIYDGGKWVFQDGKKIDYIPNFENQTWSLDMNEFDTLSVATYLADEVIRGEINLNREQLGYSQDGLNVVVYDQVRNEVVSVRNFQ